MPIDPSIPLSVRPPQIDNPVEKMLTLRNLGQQQQGQQQEQEIRQQTIESNRLKLAGQQREVSEVAALSAALKDSMETDPATGIQRPNYDKTAAKLASQGFIDMAAHVTDSATNSAKSRMAFTDQLAKFQASGKEHLGELALDAQRLIDSGQPTPVIKSGIISRVATATADGLISEDDAHRFIAQVGASDPQALKPMFDQFLTPAIREREGKIAKESADTAKVNAETTGTLPETAAQKSTRLYQEAQIRLSQERNNIARQAANPLGAITGAGSAAPQAALPTGDDFLKTLPAAQASEIKAYAEGRRPFPTGMSYAKLQPLIALVGQYDPTFDAANYNARNKARTDLTSPSGTGGKTINALNTAIQHAGRLSDLIETLDNSAYPLVNAVVNPLRTATGDTAVTNFQAVAPQLAKEIERAWRGAGGSAGEIKELTDSIGKNLGKQQQREALMQFVELAKGKLDATQQQRDNVLGPKAGGDIPILFKQNESILDAITKRASGEKEDASTGKKVGRFEIIVVK